MFTLGVDPAWIISSTMNSLKMKLACDFLSHPDTLQSYHEGIQQHLIQTIRWFCPWILASTALHAMHFWVKIINYKKIKKKLGKINKNAMIFIKWMTPGEHIDQAPFYEYGTGIRVNQRDSIMVQCRTTRVFAIYTFEYILIFFNIFFIFKDFFPQSISQFPQVLETRFRSINSSRP